MNKFPKCKDCQIFREFKSTGYGWCNVIEPPRMVKANDPACDRLKEKK